MGANAKHVGRLGSIEVVVLDSAMELLAGAEVRLSERDGKHEAKLSFERSRGAHHAAELPVGAYSLIVSHRDHERLHREVRVEPAGSREVVVLGKPGQPMYRRGTVTVPFDPEPSLIALTVRTNDRGALDQLDRLEGELGLARQEVPEALPAEHVRLLRMSRPSRRRIDEALARLSAERVVIHAGQVVGFGEDRVSFLTGELLVRFRTETSEAAALAAIAERNLELLRVVPYSPNTYHCSSGPAGRYDELEIVHELEARDDVVWAEPNLSTVVGHDSVVPSDFLWAGVWDRQLVNTPDAWQHLQDAGLQPFGEPSTLLAITDTGVVTSGGSPVHPEFQGNLSDGRPKMAGFFDFINMVPNNDSPIGNHGMGTAGTATAQADNPSSAPGVTEGLAGAAPNVQFLAMIHPSSDADIADMYIWAAGFDPQSPRAGAPARRAQGADVFSSSIGFGAGAPISATASAMLDFITSFGRGGRGCVTFQSAGNANMTFTTYRPYAAYERSIAVGASTLDPSGNEVKANYSDYGVELGVCAPSNSNTGPHNPPNSYGVLSCDYMTSGELFGHPDITTSLAATLAAGAGSIQLASVAGIAAGDRLIIGAPGSSGWEATTVSGAPNPATGTVNVATLLNAHAAGTVVTVGHTAGYTNSFGGTSSATPLTAGVACLLLSADPSLTWLEVRQILRGTVQKIDPTNTDPNGQWLDAAGNPSLTSGQPPQFSQWYGYGRIDAGAAVQRAMTYHPAQELLVRDNLADTGLVPTGVPFWDSPDIWVRNLSPAAEGAAALPAGYGSPGPHQNAIAGQDNWVYVRYANTGTATSLDFYVRVSIAHYPGLEFTYPDSFIPTNRPGTPIPTPMTPGTYLLAQVKDTDLPAGASRIINVKWPSALIPPQDVMVGGVSVHWHPCLLVDISPHDGPPVSGPHVWDSNNLGQKNVTIVYVAMMHRFEVGMVVGSFEHARETLELEIDRGHLPETITLDVDVVHPGLRAELAEEAASTAVTELRQASFPERAVFMCASNTGTVELVAAGPPNDGSPARPKAYDYRMSVVDGRLVAVLGRGPQCRLPLTALGRSAQVIRIGGHVGEDTPPGAYRVYVLQRDRAGEVVGGAELELHVVDDAKHEKGANR